MFKLFASKVTCPPGADPKSEICKNLANDSSVPSTIYNVSNTLLWFAGVIAIIIIIVSGIKIITSSGSEEKVKSGKQTLIGALIGLAIVILTYTIVNFVIRNL